MIQTLQKFSESRLAKIFLGLVALSFISVGADWFRTTDSNTFVAEVGTTKISGFDLNREVQEQANRIISQSSHSVTPEDLLKAGLPQEVLDQLVRDTLMTLEVNRLGLTVTDEAVRKRTHSLKMFQDATGTFIHARFVQVLRDNKISEEWFLDRIRKEMTQEQLSQAVTFGVRLPSEMVGPLFDLQFQHREARMLTLNPKDMTRTPSPSPKELEAFYQKHASSFTTPELRTFTTLVLDPVMIAKKNTMTEEESSEMLHKLTQELDDKIAGGATFEEVAAQTQGIALLKIDSVTANGLAYGEKLASQLPKDTDFAQELLQSVFALESTIDTPFVQAKNGTYYAIRLDKIAPQTLAPFKEKEAFALKVWQESEQFKAAQTKGQALAKSFNEAKKAIKGLVSLPALSLSKASPEVPDTVTDLVFSLRPDQAGVCLLPEGVAVVVLTKITHPDAKTKQEKLETFRENLLSQYKTDVLTAYINGLRIRYPVKVHQDRVQAMYKNP